MAAVSGIRASNYRAQCIFKRYRRGSDGEEISVKPAHEVPAKLHTPGTFGQIVPCRREADQEIEPVLAFREHRESYYHDRARYRLLERVGAD